MTTHRHPLPRCAATLASSLAALVLAGCPSQQAPKKEEKKAEVKKEEAKKPQKKAEAKKAPPPPKEPKTRTFKKGRPAPKGMTPEEVKAYAEAQGDPMKGEFDLAKAFAGDDKLADTEAGKLWVTIDTDMGKLDCQLFEEKTPGTVANFVGLARGTRPTYDKKEDKWVESKFYDDVTFHRVIDGFMVQTGDPTGSGTGNPGYVIVDEFDKALRHNKPGILSMANRGKNTGSSQFFITVAPTPQLNDKHAVFGQCPNPKVAVKISKVKTDARWDRPVEPVKIKTMTFERRK